MSEDPYLIHGQWERRQKWRSIASVWTGRILATMAGAEAEAEILGEAGVGDGDDRYRITLMFYESRDEADHARIEARLRRMARMLVRRHRADIERVAAALLDHKTLTGPEVDALLPPGFMARPVTWPPAFVEADEA